MRANPQEFLPFLLPSEATEHGVMGSAEYERYCDKVEKTSEWGGQPEVRNFLPLTLTLPLRYLHS